MTVQVIDTLMGDLTGLTACFLLPGDRPTLVETGPGRSAHHVIDALRTAGIGPGDLAQIVVTHIHLDHAGAAGALAQAFPAATVLVHPAGARHLADPSRLVASAARVHGPLMATAYGTMVPVPAERIRALDNGDRIDLGGRTLSVHHTPGHAAHHVALLDEHSGALFPGDAAGVFVRPMRVPRPATPPPDFAADLARASLQTLRALRPRHLLLTHFGAIGGSLDGADRWLAEAQHQLTRWCEVTRASLRRHGPENLERDLLDAFAEEEGLADADPARFAVFGGFAANAAGLLRWATVTDNPC